MKEKAIEIIDLSFSYSDKADVLKGLNITINEGESIGIIGPNGAGKTTFFHILCGLLKPAAGSVYIYGKESKLRKFNPNIGYVFQNPDDQLFNTTVYDDVAFGPMNLGLGALEVEKRVQDALGVTGCINFEKRPPHHLSGGEKRMAAIASVISMKPKIVIYDEPASNLDMRSRRKLIDFINSSEETKLIASHDLEFVLETCKRT
ncbi:MAG: ABC transporter ATP-binding protein, partial [Spirochaetota bacterium]|nr:ABC transporter ATP-binding protein [Spirochaetota bacterium]